MISILYFHRRTNVKKAAVFMPVPHERTSGFLLQIMHECLFCDGTFKKNYSLYQANRSICHFRLCSTNVIN